MTGYLRDFVHAVRRLNTARTFTAVCVTSLGLGMSVVIGILMFTRTMLGTPPGVQDENSRSDLLTSSGVAGLAAGVALVLSALGVYGVIAFMVATRTREIGVRVALGATRARVLGDVLGEALKLVVPGIAVGMLLAVAWVRLTAPAWYPLSGVEPLVYGFAATTAFLVAMLAGIPSAHRAGAVQPIEAIKAE